jgi:hypothetical protein
MSAAGSTRRSPSNEPRLLVHCGGSGFEYSGKGCFAMLAWDPEERKWEPY